MAAQAQNALSSSRVRSRRLPVPGSSAQVRAGWAGPGGRGGAVCPPAVNSSPGAAARAASSRAAASLRLAVDGGGEGGQDGEPFAGPRVHAGLGPGLLLLVLDVAAADGAGHGPRPPAGGVVQGPLGEVEVERPDDHQDVVGGLPGDDLLAAAGRADGPGLDALLPRGGDVGRQVQGADAGVVGLQVLPEPQHQGRGQLDEGAVVDAGLALAQVVHEQVADRPAGQVVAVDQLLGGQLPGEPGADHPDRGRRAGREGPGGVQELVEERAVPVGAGAVGEHLPAAVQQLDAVAGGDVGDQAALGRHDQPRSARPPGRTWRSRRCRPPAAPSGPRSRRGRGSGPSRRRPGPGRRWPAARPGPGG